MDRYGRPYFYHRLIFPREQSRAGRLINGPRRRIYSGSRGQINSGVHVVKSVVTTTREHQPLSERLVTRRGGDGGVQGHRPRNDRPGGCGTRHPGRFVENSRALTIRGAVIYRRWYVA